MELDDLSPYTYSAGSTVVGEVLAFTFFAIFDYFLIIHVDVMRVVHHRWDNIVRPCLALTEVSSHV